jgi:hypothetical protein
MDSRGRCTVRNAIATEGIKSEKHVKASAPESDTVGEKKIKGFVVVDVVGE